MNVGGNFYTGIDVTSEVGISEAYACRSRSICSVF